MQTEPVTFSLSQGIKPKDIQRLSYFNDQKLITKFLLLRHLAIQECFFLLVIYSKHLHINFSLTTCLRIYLGFK